MEVYLDNSATTKCYENVREIVGKIMCDDYGNPSSMQEADAKQNEGEHNTYPQHLAGGQTQQSNGSNANGYKANDSQNGNQ